MKKKGLLIVLFFGGIMVTSGFGLQSMMIPVDEDDPQIVLQNPLNLFRNFQFLHRVQIL